VTVASLPMTLAQTCIRLSHITGFTLPGMMELPGWVAGIMISPMAHCGPELSQRMSLAILIRLTAIVANVPLTVVALVGMWMGTRLQRRISAETYTRLLRWVLLVIALALLWQGTRYFLR